MDSRFGNLNQQVLQGGRNQPAERSRHGSLKKQALLSLRRQIQRGRNPLDSGIRVRSWPRISKGSFITAYDGDGHLGYRYLASLVECCFLCLHPPILRFCAGSHFGGCERGKGNYPLRDSSNTRLKINALAGDVQLKLHSF